MNHAYRETIPDPHLHWWAVPRYEQDVTIGDRTFNDPAFGNPYDHFRWLDVPVELHQKIADLIQQGLSR
jgi:hypothetical protein